jgi:hypothetical protein
MISIEESDRHALAVIQFDHGGGVKRKWPLHDIQIGNNQI